MFICTVKATTLRFVGILALSVSVLIGLAVFYTAEMERRLLSTLSLTDAELAQIYSGNAKRLLGL